MQLQSAEKLDSLVEFSATSALDQRWVPEQSKRASLHPDEFLDIGGAVKFDNSLVSQK
jgi:hypothetical protein